MRPREPALREHQTSNSTANAFLGGRPMPSWLTTGQPPANASPLVPSRKRPAPKDVDHPPRCPSKPAPNPPSISASPNLSCAPAAPPPLAVALHDAPSNPASPALPNVVASHASNSSENNILPSPAPSEDPGIHPPAPNKESAMDTARAASIVSLDDDEEDGNESVPDNRLELAVAPAPRRSMSLVSAENGASTSAPVAMRASLEQDGSGATASREEAAQHVSPQEPRSVQAAEASVPAQVGHANSTHAPATSALGHQVFEAAPATPEPCYSVNFCMAKLRQMLAFSGGRGLSAVEGVRVDLVREAVEREDRDYIHLHQLMCSRAGSLNLPPQVAARSMALKSLDLLNHLVQTREVSPSWLQWFVDFPLPFHAMKNKWPAHYMDQMRRFGNFVARAEESGWEKLQNLCFAKKLPPTAIEIENALAVHSPILQSVFHRAILRRLCDFPEPNTPAQIEFSTNAEKAFKQHQHRLAEIRSRSQEPAERAHREIAEERLYRETIINLQKRFLAQKEPLPLQARRMSQQVQHLHQPINSPAPMPHQAQSPVQSSAHAMTMVQAPAQMAHQHVVPSQQMLQPQLQVAIPRERPGTSYGVMTPTSTLQSPYLTASVQNANRQSFVQNQQVQQHSLPNGAQMGVRVTSSNVGPHGQTPGLHTMSQRQQQSPMTSQFPPPGAQFINGQMVRAPIPPVMYQPQAYQPGPSSPSTQQGSHRHIQANQLIRSNASSPSTTSQMARPAMPQIDPRRNSGTGGSPAQHQSPLLQMMFPPANHMWPPQVPDPDQTALHQADIASPILEAAHAPELGRKLFQSVVAFAIAPERLVDGDPYQKFTFPVSTEDFAKLPSHSTPSPLQRSVRRVTENSKMYRLRCARSASAEGHVWIRQTNCWPVGMFLTFNGHSLEMRKKLQHGKDLPIDLTPHIRDGENRLEISLLRRPNEEKISNFLIAIEVVGLHHYDRIKEECLSERLMPAEEVLGSIKATLSRSADDDEIAIVDSNVTINLFDPMTKCRHCEIPVRGKHCLHRECFDLDVFLNTRRRKDGPSAVDDWKCLVCNGDARPQSLVVDGFLRKIIAELSAAGQSQTSAIVVDSDGNWKPQLEDKHDARASRSRASHSSTPVSRQTSLFTSTPVLPEPSARSEVIELE